jgi:hypothetical protein
VGIEAGFREKFGDSRGVTLRRFLRREGDASMDINSFCKSPPPFDGADGVGPDADIPGGGGGA